MGPLHKLDGTDLLRFHKALQLKPVWYLWYATRTGSKDRRLSIEDRFIQVTTFKVHATNTSFKNTQLNQTFFPKDLAQKSYLFLIIYMIFTYIMTPHTKSWANREIKTEQYSQRFILKLS